MHITRTRYESTGLRRSCLLLVLLSLSAMLSGCFFQKAVRDINRVGYLNNEPWWCKGASDAGVSVLTESECVNLSLQFDGANYNANLYPTVGDLPAEAVLLMEVPVDGLYAYQMSTTRPTEFEPTNPNVRLYADSTDESRLIGVGWFIDSVTAPEGYPGDRDSWSQINNQLPTDPWYLSAWIVQGYENHPNVFAASHPCVDSAGVISHTASSACYTSSHTTPLEILVTNDDGVDAEGIDTLVEALRLEPNVSVTVVAPKFNQSGSSNQTSPVSELSEEASNTLSGYAATAIASTDLSPPRNGSGSPADAVSWALGQQNLSPDLVISGTNKGQNIGAFAALSGTVGAARTARQKGVPSIATSTGGEANIIVGPFDFATATTETLSLFRDWRLGLRTNSVTAVESINIPSCETGFPLRGTIESVLTVAGCIPSNPDIVSQSCDPGIGDPAADGATDVEAFHNGYVSIANVGWDYSAQNCPP